MNIYLPYESASLIVVVLLKDTGVVDFSDDDVELNVVGLKVDSSVDLAVVISSDDVTVEAETVVPVDVPSFDVVSFVVVFCVDVSVTMGAVVVMVVVVDVATVSVVLTGETVVVFPGVLDVVSDDAVPVSVVIVIPVNRVVVLSGVDVALVDVKVVIDEVDSVVIVGLTGVVSDPEVAVTVLSLILVVVSCKFVVVEATGFVVSSFTVVEGVVKVDFVVDTNVVDVERSKEGVTHESSSLQYESS